MIVQGCKHQANKETCQLCDREFAMWKMIFEYADENNLTTWQAMCEISAAQSLFTNSLRELLNWNGNDWV